MCMFCICGKDGHVILSAPSYQLNPPILSISAHPGTLRLNSNHLVGTIPSELLMGTKDLQVFHVGHNALTGHLPDVFDASQPLNMLEQFHVQHNQLSGSLPKSMGHLTHLHFLEIDHNKLSGSVPLEWSYLTHLEILRMV